MFSAKETVELLERAVAEKGYDYVYPVGEPGYSDEKSACLYGNETTGPLCIVGHVLSYVDLLGQVVEGTEAGELFVIDNNFDADAKELLIAAQWKQDDGLTWRESVDHAVSTALSDAQD